MEENKGDRESQFSPVYANLILQLLIYDSKPIDIMQTQHCIGTCGYVVHTHKLQERSPICSSRNDIWVSLSLFKFVDIYFVPRKCLQAADFLAEETRLQGSFLSNLAVSPSQSDVIELCKYFCW